MHYKRSIGGLVTALDPVMNLRGGVWIGWSGLSKKIKYFEDNLKIRVGESDKYQIKIVNLNEKDINLFYHGFTNRTLWPLFHGFLLQSYFNYSYWLSYKSANKKYSKSVLEETGDDDIVWVHDYHLMLVPKSLRKNKPGLKIIFFLHIPFPNVEIFRALPWHNEILEGLLGCDLITFQTEDDSDNFLASCKKLLDLKVNEKDSTIKKDSRTINVKHFPISIDYEGFKEISKNPSTQKILKRIRKSTENQKIILSVERLDYTKGIKERLLSIERFFEKYPGYRKKVVFMQISVPSRTKIREYITLKNETDELVGRINGRFTEELWTPVTYLYQSFKHEELAAYYAAADVCLITPLRDGMNLIAKEYVTAKGSGNGVVILSEFAGAAEEFSEHSIMVNPYDVESIADSIYMALKMDAGEKNARIKALRRIVKENDVFKWSNNILNYFQTLS
jgi:alpha,alpha-trehalose-phosphate synthase [UDP-forming]